MNPRGRLASPYTSRASESEEERNRGSGDVEAERQQVDPPTRLHLDALLTLGEATEADLRVQRMRAEHLRAAVHDDAMRAAFHREGDHVPRECLADTATPSGRGDGELPEVGLPRFGDGREGSAFGSNPDAAEDRSVVINGDPYVSVVDPAGDIAKRVQVCLLYTSPSPRDS